MINIILAIPIDTELTPEQSIAVQSVKAQWVTMPGTRVYNGKYVVDALVKDAFTSSMLPEEWEIFYSGQGEINTLFIDYLNDIVTYDDNGDELTRVRPTELAEPHRFGGWSARLAM